MSHDDLVCFKLPSVDFDGRVEEAFKVVRICDRTESVTIGFLPYNIVKSEKKSLLFNLLG